MMFFLGKIVHCIICTNNIAHIKERTEDFFQLSLEKTPSLIQSLELFLKSESLEGDNSYHCESCGKKVNSLMKYYIGVAPPIFIISLKLMFFDFETFSKVKNTNRTKFPEVLNMNAILGRDTQISTCYDDMNFPSDQKESLIERYLTQGPNVYQLYGMVVFLNDHYIAYVKSSVTNSWRKFYDKVVTDVVEFDVDMMHEIESNCYLLFYSKII